MVWKAGQSGNPTGRGKKEKPWREAIQRAIKRHAAGDLQALDRAADALVKAAIDGKLDAQKELGDRLDGKPAQAIIGGDEDDPPLRTVSRIELVDLVGSPSSAPSET